MYTPVFRAFPHLQMLSHVKLANLLASSKCSGVVPQHLVSLDLSIHMGFGLIPCLERVFEGLKYLRLQFWWGFPTSELIPLLTRCRNLSHLTLINSANDVGVLDFLFLREMPDLRFFAYYCFGGLEVDQAVAVGHNAPMLETFATCFSPDSASHFQEIGQSLQNVRHLLLKALPSFLKPFRKSLSDRSVFPELRTIRIDCAPRIDPEFEMGAEELFDDRHCEVSMSKLSVRACQFCGRLRSADYYCSRCQCHCFVCY